MEWEVHEKTCRRQKRNVLVVEKPADGKNKAVFGFGNVSGAKNKAVSAVENVSDGSTALSVSGLRKMAFFGPVLGRECRFLTISN